MSYKILTAELLHETNTFSRIKTDEQAFHDCYFLTGSNAIVERGEQNTQLAGFLDIGS
jgi:microcystin degradation protein MlrC